MKNAQSQKKLHDTLMERLCQHYYDLGSEKFTWDGPSDWELYGNSIPRSLFAIALFLLSLTPSPQNSGRVDILAGFMPAYRFQANNL